MSSGKTQQTATEHALLLPEILSRIFKWIVRDEDGSWGLVDEENDTFAIYDSLGVVLRCALVNKLWFREAMPILWRRPGSLIYRLSVRGSLPYCMKMIETLERRQLYASFVREALLVSVAEGAELAEELDAALQGVEFPKLNRIDLVIDDRGGGFYLPRIDGRHVEGVMIDPRFEIHPDIYGPSRADTDTVIDQLPVRYSCTSHLI